MKVFTQRLLLIITTVVIYQSASSIGLCEQLFSSLSPHKQNIELILNEINKVKVAEVEAKFELSLPEYNRLKQVVINDRLYTKNYFLKKKLSYDLKTTIYKSSYLSSSTPSLNISLRNEPNVLLLILKKSSNEIKFNKLPIFIKGLTIERVENSFANKNANPIFFTAKTYRTNLKLKSIESDELGPIQILLDKTLYYQGDRFISTSYELEIEMPLFKTAVSPESYKLKLLEFLKLTSSLKKTFNLKNQTSNKFEKGLELLQ